ncbi:hypothetical protein K502DRAFT_322885 [Neoconidiobolus thromboides FSU 785]|nr:hypothetical protein K502DRAFT_322885 [Neoconidiobolus thromboides FSU 785]
MSENQIINGIQNAIEQIREGSGYTSIVLPEYFQTIEGEIGRLVQEFIVEEKHLNPGHSLQGGFIAYLVDACGAYVVSTIPKINYGVSVDINISYLASAKLGDKVTVVSKIKVL